MLRRLDDDAARWRPDAVDDDEEPAAEAPRLVFLISDDVEAAYRELDSGRPGHGAGGARY